MGPAAVLPAHLLGSARHPLCCCRDVEMWFQDNGYLLPNYHKFYWMGLVTGE